MILSTTDWMQVVDWSRAQFAMTAIYHWLFVPLTLGLGIICAIMESIYYRTGNEFWKRTTKFWMRIFGINFAIGVATGIILEFEFGTNWSNYSHFVGDIFGAPLAIIVCADTSEAWTRKYDGKNISDLDASLVTDHMKLAAASLHLDTLWLCMFKPAAEREEFALPANVEPVNILLIGYGDGPAADPNRHDTLRKPLSATVFHERF